MRFVTYNIRLGIQEGVDALGDVLRPERPDVLALQEVGRAWTMGPPGDTTKELACALGLSHHHFVPCIDEEGAQYGHALLSRFPLRVIDTIDLPRDVDEPRRLLVAEIDAPFGSIHVVSTHLSWIEDRARQAPVLLDVVGTLPEPYVVMGDLNAEDEPFVRTLEERHEDADGAARRKTFPSTEPAVRIDHLFARGGTWSDTTVGANATASDHLYVAATLQLATSSFS